MPSDRRPCEAKAGASDVEPDEPLYIQAVEHVRSTGRGSITSVQRKLLIGYNRAARLVERMEREGVVAPMHNGNREVPIPAA